MSEPEYDMVYVEGKGLVATRPLEAGELARVRVEDYERSLADWLATFSPAPEPR